MNKTENDRNMFLCFTSARSTSIWKWQHNFFGLELFGDFNFQLGLYWNCSVSHIILVTMKLFIDLSFEFSLDLLPSLVFVVPFRRKAVDRVHFKFQHAFQLGFAAFKAQTLWIWWVNWKKNMPEKRPHEKLRDLGLNEMDMYRRVSTR